MAKNWNEIKKKMGPERVAKIEKAAQEVMQERLDEGKPKFLSNFYLTWRWLVEHPAFQAKGRMGRELAEKGFTDSRFAEVLDIDVQKVNPITNRVDEDQSLNTQTEIWLECGAIWNPTEEDLGHPVPEQEQLIGATCHDLHLDSSAETFEIAIMNLGRLVYEKYGDYEQELS